MRRLIAVVTCHAGKYRERANAQRETWVKTVPGSPFDLKFFLGTPPTPDIVPQPDEVFLPVDDGYHGMPAKVQAMCKWAFDAGYDYVFKTDDDCYISIANLLAAPHAPHDYVGRFRGPSGGYPADYASGFGYHLSRRAMEVVASAPLNGDWAEDRYVATVLAAAGIQGWTDTQHYVACYPGVVPEHIFHGGLRWAAVWCEYPPALIRRCHQIWSRTRPPTPNPVQLKAVPIPGANRPVPAAPNDKPPDGTAYVSQPTPNSVIVPRRKMADLNTVCVLLKTFLRDGFLLDTVRMFEKEYPEIRMVIMDDGYPTSAKDAMYQRLQNLGHTCEYLPFDSGFGAKANAAIRHFDRPYVLVGADDFNFDEPGVREGIERMVTVIDGVPALGVASGRVDNHPYKGFLSYGGNFIKETALTMGDWLEVNGVEYKLCNLTVNYSIVRTEALLGKNERPPIRWKEEFKIGGEHFWFFYDMGKAGWQTAFVPGVNIAQRKYEPSKIHPDYGKYRGRAIECVGKFVRMWVKERGGRVPDNFYYIGFGEQANPGNDYVRIAKARGLM